MQDPVEFIQKSVLRDPSRILTPILAAIVEEVQREIFAYHDWKFAIRYTTKALEQNVNRYEISGADNDIDKVKAMRYGENFQKMDPCSNMERFYDIHYNRLSRSTPQIWVPESKTAEHIWTVFIYPVEITSPENITYWYKRRMLLTDFLLFDNPMVLVDGTLWRFFTNEKDWRRADIYLSAYIAGRERMKDNDGVMVYPDKKIVSSRETQEFRDQVASYRDQRRR
jgi:hypothetical protein